MEYMFAVEYHSSLKRKKILTQATWMPVEDIKLGEKSHSQKRKYCMIPFI
jgi:hypothetical protein